MSAELTIKLRISADRRIVQALFAVAVFALFTIEYSVFRGMKAAVMYLNQGGRSLLKKSFGVKFT